MKNVEPDQWRETIDPRTLPLKAIRIQEVLGYPHAANQVFYVRAREGNREGYYYVKYAHHADANIQNEVQVLGELCFPGTPRLVEYDRINFRFSVTEQLVGKRLSTLMAEAGREDALGYLYEYGQTLARLHGTTGTFPEAPARRFHEIPEQAHFQKLGLEDVYRWLWDHRPSQVHRCFVHGDFHYANILWNQGHISGILDFELSGMGNREFDIAWALILRPGQKFLKTEGELAEFLDGYRSLESLDWEQVRYYMVLIYSRFLTFGDESYEQDIRRRLQQLLKEEIQC